MPQGQAYLLHISLHCSRMITTLKILLYYFEDSWGPHENLSEFTFSTCSSSAGF